MRKRHKGFIGMLTFCVLISGIGVFFSNEHLRANNQSREISKGDSYADQNDLFLKMDEDGGVTYVDDDLSAFVEDTILPERVNRKAVYELKRETADGTLLETSAYASYKEASHASEEAMLASSDIQKGNYHMSIYVEGQLRATTKPAIVQFKVRSNGQTTPYQEVGTNINGYTSAAYAQDAAYLGTEKGKIKFKFAGVIGYVSPEYVNIVEFNQKSRVSYYYVSKHNLYHKIYTPNNESVQRVGKAPGMMKENVTYYSYDGHYFYTSYKSMVDDYKAGTTTNAINKNNVFYNYYQFISLRTKTDIPATYFDQRVSSKTSSKSKLTKQGKAFVSAQQYGVNALLSFGIAVNESGWGNSSIAQSKNNIFGLNAVDTNPGMAANTFPSVQACIYDFAKNWMSKGYLSPFDWRYYGPHLGDKQSGINVKYASDPYWGEKAAAQAYFIEDLAGVKESEKYSLLMETGNQTLKVFIEPLERRGMLYRNGDVDGKVIHQFPFIVLSSVENSEGTWLKIKTDAILLKDRSYVDHDSDGIYHDEINYGYIKASDTMLLVTNGRGGNKPLPPKPNPKPEPPKPKPEPSKPKPKPSIVAGDVNGDGKLSPQDYVMIKHHIMGQKKLKGNALKAADANKDGKISPSDYVVVKNRIMGK